MHLKTIRFLFSIYLCFISQLSYAQLSDSLKKYTENTAFQIGEELTYEIKYGIFKGGEAKMVINLFPNGENYVYHIKALAYTTGLTSKMVTIHDIYESFVDISTGLPVKAIRNIREQNYYSYDEVLFLRNKNQIYSVNKGFRDVPVNTLDILSAFYYARRFLFSTKMKPGEVIDLTTFFDGDLLPIRIKLSGTENISFQSEDIKCLKFVPFIDKSSPFKSEKDLQIWVTDDGNYVPIKIRVNLAISSLKADLIDVYGLKNKHGNVLNK